MTVNSVASLGPTSGTVALFVAALASERPASDTGASLGGGLARTERATHAVGQQLSQAADGMLSRDGRREQESTGASDADAGGYGSEGARVVGQAVCQRTGSGSSASASHPSPLSGSAWAEAAEARSAVASSLRVGRSSLALLPPLLAGPSPQSSATPSDSASWGTPSALAAASATAVAAVDGGNASGEASKAASRAEGPRLSLTKAGGGASKPAATPLPGVKTEALSPYDLQSEGEEGKGSARKWRRAMFTSVFLQRTGLKGEHRGGSTHRAAAG
jgi:hypothetical protein